MSHTFASRRSANRRRRNEARQRILDAARRELETKPFRELSVDDLMKRPGSAGPLSTATSPIARRCYSICLKKCGAALADARDAELGNPDIAAPPPPWLAWSSCSQTTGPS